MAVMQMREAIRRAMEEEMDRDERVFLMGEEVGNYQGAYKVSQGMLEKYGPKRIVDTPISECGFSGIGVGAAMVGLRPIIEYMSFSFSLVAIDQIVNNAANMRYMSGGQFSSPIVFRGLTGLGTGIGATHSHRLEAWYSQIPGLTVLVPCTPADAKGLLKSAIRSDDPVLYFEPETLYGFSGEVPDDEVLIPIGKADIKRPGKDVTLITYAYATHTSLDAAKALEKEGVDVEVIDLRSLRPLDIDTLIESIKKTHRAVIVEEDWPYCGMGAGVADRIYHRAFDELDAPIRRVTTLDAPIPYAKSLEWAMVPTKERIIKAVNQVLYR